MTSLHSVWSYAHDLGSSCTEGYNKEAFKHVQYWFEKYEKAHFPDAERQTLQAEIDRLRAKLKETEATLDKERSDAGWRLQAQYGGTL